MNQAVREPKGLLRAGQAGPVHIGRLTLPGRQGLGAPVVDQVERPGARASMEVLPPRQEWSPMGRLESGIDRHHLRLPDP